MSLNYIPELKISKKTGVNIVEIGYPRRTAITSFFRSRFQSLKIILKIRTSLEIIGCLILLNFKNNSGNFPEFKKIDHFSSFSLLKGGGGNGKRLNVNKRKLGSHSKKKNYLHFVRISI